MKCPNCGSFIDDGRDVCFICGANVAESASNANGSFGNNMNQSFNNTPNNDGMGNMDNQGYNNMNQDPNMNQGYNNMGQDPGMNQGYNNMGQDSGMNQGFGMNQDPGMNQGFDMNQNNQNFGNYPNNQMYGNQMYGGQPNNNFGMNNTSTSYSDTSGNMLDNSPQFSTGMGDSSKSFGTNNGGFNTSNGYSIKSNLQEELNKNGSEKYFKNGEKDIFDFIEEHKMLVNIGLCLLLAVILFLAGRLYYNARLREHEPQGVFQNLYLEYDKSLVFSGANNAMTLSRNNGVDSDCIITITTNNTTSDNYVKTYYKDSLGKHNPDRDVNYGIINKLQIYTYQEGSYDLAGTKWNYLNMFYKVQEQTEYYKSLKYTYLTSNYNGVNYNIEIQNTSEDKSNEKSCRYSVDNVIKSLRFVENAASKK